MLHRFLQGESQLYAKWHEHPRHTFHHFLVLSALSVGVTLSLLTAVFSVESNPESQLAAPITSVTAQAPQNMQGMTNQLFRAIDTYVHVSGKAKGVALAQAEDLLARRADMLAKLMEENPGAALLEVLPEDLLASIPKEIADKLEHHVSIEGSLVVRKFDYFDEHRVEYEFSVKDRSGKGTFLLHSPQWINAGSGSLVTVEGASIGGHIVFAGGGSGGGLTVTEPASLSTSYSVGTKKVLVAMVNFSDESSQPYTAAQMRDMWFTGADSVAAHYAANSFGKLTLTGDVIPNYITVPLTKAQVCSSHSYDLDMINAINSGAQAQGFTPTNYDIRPSMMLPGCPWGGFAYYPNTVAPYGGFSWNNMYGQPSMQEVSEHELGHSLGQNHASTYNCGSTSVGSGCTLDEYGESADPLGTYNGQYNHYNAAHKHNFGWVTGANVQTVTNGTYTIAPLETSSGSAQVLRILKSDTGEYYYVGYRQPVGLDAGLPASLMRGASIWLMAEANAYPVDQSKLIDTTPGDGNLLDSASLQDGATFTDSANGLTITQTTHDAGGVTLQVSKTAAACVAGQTTASISPLTQTASGDGQTVQYTVTISNGDSSTCTAQSYNLSGSVPSGWAGTFGATPLTVNPGSSAQTTFHTTAPAGTANGSYTVSALATGADAAHTAQSSATHIIFLDTQAPTVTISSPASGSALKGVSVTVSANATDNIGVTKVEFSVDGVVQVTDTVTPYTFKWNIKKASKGAHTITAKAYDVAGNVGTASASVSI